MVKLSLQVYQHTPFFPCLQIEKTEYADTAIAAELIQFQENSAPFLKQHRQWKVMGRVQKFMDCKSENY